MPLFEYRCRQCGHVTTFLEKPGARRSHRCEECGSEDTEKMLSAFSTKSGDGSAGPTCPTGTCPLS